MRLKNKYLKVLILGCFLILAVNLLSGCQKNVSEKSAENNINLNEPAKELAIEYSPLSGKLPIAIVLDNFLPSRPVSGISNAAVVYEAPVEADITRFLAIFDQDSLPEKIGPIRSARPYLAELAEEYGALFIHAGGSPDAIQKLKQNYWQIYNLDEVSGNGVYFFRLKTRVAPFNTYVSKASIEQFIKNKNLTNTLLSNFVGWKFSRTRTDTDKTRTNTDLTRTNTENVSVGRRAGQRESVLVKVNYHEPVFWEYDSPSGDYLCFRNGEPFIDADNNQIKTKNLVIQKTKIVVLDEIGRRSIELTGEGEAIIFQGGQVIEGKWQKTAAGSRTKFYNLSGEEIEFLPGSIWVEIVSPEHELLY